MLEYDFPVGESIRSMIEQDDFSPTQAVDQLRAAAIGISPGHYAEATAYLIMGLAMNIPHDQQSKLIDFLVLLQKMSIPDPNGGILLYDTTPFWSRIPALNIILLDYRISIDTRNPQNSPETNQEFENLTAFIAQLSEINLHNLNETTFWTYYSLCEILIPDETFWPDTQPTRVEVRAACLWFIYAPKKVWDDAFFCREHDDGERFEPGIWEKWNEFLMESQSRFLDEDTQELMRHALISMDRIEGSQRGHT